MGMFSLLKEWINERGSANIMEKRLALLQDEKGAVEKAKAASEARVRELATKLKEADLRLANVLAENVSLRKALSAYTAPQYTPEAERILLQLSRFMQPEKTTDLAERLNLSYNVLLHHLCELENLSYVRGTRWSESDITWLVSDDGRRHLALQGLLT